MIDALEIKHRRKLGKADNYIPNGGQIRVHKSEKKIRVVTAGNGGGKTACAANEAIWAANGYNPTLDKNSDVPARIIVLVDQPIKIASTWLPELKKWTNLKPEQLHKDGKPYIARVSFPNGSELIFMTHDMDPMIFESIELDMLIADEPFPRHIWIALFRGGRKKGRVARFLLVGTPISGSWLREELVEPWSRGEFEDCDVIKYGTIENQANLADGYIEQFSRVLTEKERRIRLEGEFADLDGLALAHLFNRKHHVVSALDFNWPPHWPVVIAIDPALAKKHVALALGVTPQNKLIALREFAFKGDAKTFGRHLVPWMRGLKIVDIVVDSLGSGDLTGGDGVLSFIAALNDELAKSRYRCRATTFDEKQDEAWLTAIQNVLTVPVEPDNFGKMEPQLKILDTCTGLIHDIETVSWEKYRLDDIYKPKLDIKKKDYLACLKYGIAAQPAFDKGRETVIRPRGGSAGIRNRDLTFKRNR